MKPGTWPQPLCSAVRRRWPGPYQPGTVGDSAPVWCTPHAPTSGCVVILRTLASLSLCLHRSRWGRHSFPVWWGLGFTLELGGCLPSFLSPSYGETWDSQEDTEETAVDSPRSWALRSLKRNQPHLTLDWSLRAAETKLPDCCRAKPRDRAGP